MSAREGMRLVIGISGDSGSGKDTLARGTGALFGCEQTTQLSGDDYHLAERHDPLWERMTHLDPAANDLARLAADVAALARGEDVSVRPYDHGTGRFGPVWHHAPRPVVIVNGLHTLYTAELRAQLDLRVHLDTDEELRVRLKMRRDVQQRNHTRAELAQLMVRRGEDAERYIRPQAQHADLVLRLRPEDPRMLAATELADTVPLVLDAFVTAPLAGYAADLVRRLGTHARSLPLTNAPAGMAVGFHIHGAPSRAALAEVATSLHPSRCPDPTPETAEGVLGATELLIWHLALRVRET